MTTPFDDDRDRDGHLALDAPCAEGPLPKDDCDDADSSIYAGAVERCNAVDDDCDGRVDEDARLWCTDRAHGDVDQSASALCGRAGGAPQCRVASCGLERADCDGVLGNGCEVDTASDAANCGSCGVVCPSGACAAGICSGFDARMVALHAMRRGTCGISDAGHALCWGAVGFRGRQRPTPLADEMGDPYEDVRSVVSDLSCLCILQGEGLTSQILCQGRAQTEVGPGLCAAATSGTTTGFLPVRDAGGDVLRDVTQVTAGNSHGCALTSAGEVWCWGAAGRLGVTGGAASSVPVRVSVTGGTPLTGIVQIDAGGTTTCAIQGTTRDVYCWGSQNSQGQLGQGTLATSQVALPVLTRRTPSAVRLQADEVLVGGAHACALDETSGDLFCWGDSADCAVADCPSGDQWLAVARAGGVSGFGVSQNFFEPGHHQSPKPGHVCAVWTAGGLGCWGAEDADADLGGSWTGCINPEIRCPMVGRAFDSPPPGDEGLRALPTPDGGGSLSLALGEQFTCALVDGWPECWGKNTFRQLGIGDIEVDVGWAVQVPRRGVPTQVDIDDEAACARLSGGGVACWGNNVATGRVVPALYEPTRTPPSAVDTSYAAFAVDIDEVREVRVGRSVACARNTGARSGAGARRTPWQPTTAGASSARCRSAPLRCASTASKTPARSTSPDSTPAR